MKIQLEEFATDPFCSPQAIAPCHLLDQGHRLSGDDWCGRNCSGPVFPKELEALAMPPQQCLWLDNDEGLFPAPNYPCQKNQKHPVRFGTGGSFHLSPQDDQLLTQECVFYHEVGTCFWQGLSASPGGARWCLVWSKRGNGGGATEGKDLSTA